MKIMQYTVTRCSKTFCGGKLNREAGTYFKKSQVLKFVPCSKVRIMEFNFCREPIAKVNLWNFIETFIA